MELPCPQCKLINPPDATRCDCGWEFSSGRLSQHAEHVQQALAAKRAMWSWLCRVIAWASQVLLTLALGGMRGLGAMWLVAAVVQFVLIIAGLYFGVKVLLHGRQFLPSRTRGAAIIGVILSGGTILLIVGLAVMSVMS